MIHRFAVTVLIVLGCANPAHPEAANSTLPEFAVPKGEIVDPTRVDRSDLIFYRALVRADFKGEQLPAHLVQYADKVGALTCGHIFTTPDTKLKLEPTRSRNGGVRYRATLHQLGFVAQMDRNCSWWNPNDVGLSASYLLQHEQIHFALFELEARALNASVSEIAAQIDATSDSPEAAAQAAQEQLERQVQKGLNAVLERSREFDEDTSMGHHPEQQGRWWQLVESELSAPAR